MTAAPNASAFSSAGMDSALLLGGIGPVTSTGEMVVRWSRSRRELAVVDAGYFGGIGMAVAVAVEATSR